MRHGNTEPQNVTASTAAEYDANKKLVGTRAISNTTGGGATDILDRDGVQAEVGAVAPAAHASSHQNGGADEINVGGLSGVLADAQTPTSHAASHQNGGADEIATATPAANAIPKAGAGATLDANWLPTANTSTKGAVELATDGESAASLAVQANDSRLSDSRTPTSHNNSAHSETYITSAGVTYENLNSNGDIGTTANTVAAGDDSRFDGIDGALNDNDAFFISHTLSSGTDGGGTTATAWTVCPFNTEEYDTLTVTLSSNTFVLPAGDYICEGYHVIYDSGVAKLRLRNTTGSTTLLVGGSTVSGTISSQAPLSGRFTVAASQTLQVEYYVGTGKATDGLGLKTTSGESEVFGYMKFYKVG